MPGGFGSQEQQHSKLPCSLQQPESPLLKSFGRACEALGRVQRSSTDWPRRFGSLGNASGQTCGTWHVHCADDAPPVPGVRRLSRPEVERNTSREALALDHGARIGVFALDPEGSEKTSLSLRLLRTPEHGFVFQAEQKSGRVTIKKELNTSSRTTEPVQGRGEATLLLYLPSSGPGVKERVRGIGADFFEVEPQDSGLPLHGSSSASSSSLPPAAGQLLRVNVSIECAPGEKVSNESSSLCEECPPGTFNTAGLGDQRSCQPARPGYHGPTPGLTDAVSFPCDYGTFSDRRGSVNCTKCPGGEGVTSPRASDKISDCRCKQGYWVAGSGEKLACKPCNDTRVVCGQEGLTVPLPATQGVFIDVEAAQDPSAPADVAIMSCWPPESCKRYATTEGVMSEECNSDSYTSTACMRCAPGHFRVEENGAGRCA